VRIAAPIERVYDALATDAGRASFWAESAVESGGVIHFRFPDGTEYASRILRAERPHLFAIEYFESIVTFTLSGETEVSMVNEGVADDERAEVIAGWVSVLLQMKAAIQFGVDLRNHSRDFNWRTGYAEN
jgi:uncharacterized protein YndB with AHSA1/START domain